MKDELHDFVKLLEEYRAEGQELETLLRVEPVRHLSLPLCHETCAELRAMAEVFQCDEALLASAILRGALRHMQLHLNDDLDALAALARDRLCSPCEDASEAI